MCLINVIKMYRNSFTSWIGRNFLFSWDFFLLSLLPPTFVSHRVCIKEMILFSSLFSRNLKQRKKQISIRKTDPGGKQTRKNRKKAITFLYRGGKKNILQKYNQLFDFQLVPNCTKERCKTAGQDSAPAPAPGNWMHCAVTIVGFSMGTWSGWS